VPAPLEEALTRVMQNDGAVASEIRNAPDGLYAYCKDPDGTRFGLFTPS
jgi:predicted enzyme related to lactoylglutathione lyase